MTAELNLRPTDNEIAESVAAISANDYIGRFVLGGKDEEGTAVQINGITVRSTKNRMYQNEGDIIRVVATDKTPAEMAEDPDEAWIYYPAAMYEDQIYVVSNGAHTSHILDGIFEEKSIESALRSAPTVNGIDLSSYEGDSTNTSRIAGVIDGYKESPSPFGLAIVRKAADSDEKVYASWQAKLDDLPPGVGYLIHTYKHNAPSGQPIPPFDRSHPVLVPLVGGHDKIVEDMKSIIHPEHFIAMYARSIDLAVGGLKESIYSRQHPTVT
jgi:IMP cyclohydrolase